MTAPFCMRLLRLAAFASALTGLAGCGDGGEQDVRQWMNDTRSQARVSIPKLAEPKKFIPFAYSEKSSVDPFNPVKLHVVLARQQQANTSKFKPNLARRKEALEAYPLDGLRMVGTMQSKSMTYALIEVDKMVHSVKMGAYLGQNFGMVTRITDTYVEVKEVIQDSSGEWIERPARLELQETKK